MAVTHDPNLSSTNSCEGKANSLGKVDAMAMLNHSNFLGFAPGIQRGKSKPGSTQIMHFTCKWPSGDTYQGHAEGASSHEIRESVIKQFAGAEIVFGRAQW